MHACPIIEQGIHMYIEHLVRRFYRADNETCDSNNRTKQDINTIIRV